MTTFVSIIDKEIKVLNKNLKRFLFQNLASPSYKFKIQLLCEFLCLMLIIQQRLTPHAFDVLL